MSKEKLDETHDECGTHLVRVSEDDSSNPHTFPIVRCPECLEIVGKER
ncbi:MAG: hypothetical protein ABEH81_04215 [Halopenitus sp.]